jgi:hypothetical protein
MLTALCTCCAVLFAEGGNVPVVVMFSKGKGKPKQDALEVKAAIDAKSLDGVFLATNNLTYAAGAWMCTRQQHAVPHACGSACRMLSMLQ